MSVQNGLPRFHSQASSLKTDTNTKYALRLQSSTPLMHMSSPIDFSWATQVLKVKHVLSALLDRGINNLHWLEFLTSKYNTVISHFNLLQVLLLCCCLKIWLKCSQGLSTWSLYVWQVLACHALTGCVDPASAH